jgi:hypothetical protein
MSSGITKFTKPEHVTERVAKFLTASGESDGRCNRIQRNFIEMLYYLLGPLAPIEPIGYNITTMEPIFKYKKNRIPLVTPESKAIIAEAYNNFKELCKTLTPNRFGKLQTAYTTFLDATSHIPVAAEGGGGSALRRSTRRKQRKQRKTRRH